MPPLSLYIHIPWCLRKCPYCDFNSHTAGQSLPETAYVDALLADLDNECAYAANRPLVSIFFGGGTPSLFSGAAIARILDGVRERLALHDDCEITLEANPGASEQARFAAYREAGVNRLSIGVQSFQTTQLKALGRVHDSADARRAIAAAQAAGFSRINVDLMHGLPQQTAEHAEQDLHTAIDAGVTHISWYQLGIEPNTVFFSKPPPLPAESELEAIQNTGEALLRQHGFEQYEVSAWACGDRGSRHNRHYWTFGDYLGIGAGAHGKRTQADGRILRRWKTRAPADYLKSGVSVLAGEKTVAADELPLEFLMNALRLRDGVATVLFTERTGLPLSVIQPAWHELRQRGLMQNRDDRLVTTETGFRYLDSVLQVFFK